MQNRAHALARAELIRVLTAYTGITTAAGAADGSTLEDSNLIGVNDFVTNKTILIMSGDANYETKEATIFNPLTGVITVAPPFSAQIAVGTIFRILNIPTGSTLSIVLGIVGATFDIVNALLMLTETGGTVTTTGPGTEDDVYVNDDPAGVFEPVKVQIDFSAQTAAETVVVRIYYRIKTGGTPRLKDEVPFAGVQDPPLKNIELEPNRFGIAVTIERIAGAAQDYDWEVFFKT